MGTSTTVSSERLERRERYTPERRWKEEIEEKEWRKVIFFEFGGVIGQRRKDKEVRELDRASIASEDMVVSIEHLERVRDVMCRKGVEESQTV